VSYRRGEFGKILPRYKGCDPGGGKIRGSKGVTSTVRKEKRKVPRLGSGKRELRNKKTGKHGNHYREGLARVGSYSSPSENKPLLLFFKHR